MTSAETEEAFTRFVEDAEPRLQRALVGTFGPEVGGEATRDALAYQFGRVQAIQLGIRGHLRTRHISRPSIHLTHETLRPRVLADTS